MHFRNAPCGGYLMSNGADLEKRLAALEQGTPRQGAAPNRRSLRLALLIVGLILVGGAVLYLFSQPEEEVALPTATPDEFQTEGDGFVNALWLHWAMTQKVLNGRKPLRLV